MLTKAQLDARAGKLTASRIKVLMTGDAAGILRLYEEMIGEREEEDLSQVWPVRLGEATEQLNLDWLEMGGLALSRRGEVVQHKRHDWAAATLDAWCDELACPVEAKHVGGREPLEVVIDRYQPQMQWQMAVTGASKCLLTVIMGANPPLVEHIERSEPYIREMLARASQFMLAVARHAPPVTLPAVPSPVIAEKTYDMAGNAAWEAAADRWMQTHGAAEAAKDAEKALKGMVPADAVKAFGRGVRITRNRAGALSLREDK
jgi:predicted phage-related endonuclease